MEIDIKDYKGREQAFVKHYLLWKYLQDFAHKVTAAWEEIVYVDGFAGPWQSSRNDRLDTSFGVAVACLTDSHRVFTDKGRNIKTRAVLVESDSQAFAKLQEYCSIRRDLNVDLHAIHGKFADQVRNVESYIKPDAFRFVLLDPKGWSDIPMSKLQHFLRHRSCEVVINLMTSHIVRFLNEASTAKSFIDLFGRPEAYDAIKRASPGAAQDLVVSEYCRSLSNLCGFRYVSSAVVLNPKREAVMYFLIYATNHPKGINVFKSAERQAARVQDVVRRDLETRKTKQPYLNFDSNETRSSKAQELRDRYCSVARRSILSQLAEADAEANIPFDGLYCEAMQFPLVQLADLRAWIREAEPHVRIHLAGGTRRHELQVEKGDIIHVIDPIKIGQLLESPH